MDVIAIDGPAGSGKSTVAPLVADKLGLKHLDTGLMYRTIAFRGMTLGLDLADEKAFADLADEIDFRVYGGGVVEIEGVKYKEELRTEEVSAAVSPISANVDVRNELVKRQREWIEQNNGGVLDGRDIGTVVYPEARLKVFLVADIDERAQRRASQSGESVEQIKAAIEARDHADSTRESMPLKKADDAVELDTTELSIDEVVAKIASLFAESQHS